jgi:hypothetical protein
VDIPLDAAYACRECGVTPPRRLWQYLWAQNTVEE